ncbi:glutathione S-transferase [Pseudomonas fontis]|uniref:Glutathione S-transferase n=1 Tax=Pseudomonas fontis TaxID=2942633 RepID=A0ABT5NVL4_9PSED|nr:glutathione S-transferase [Pseudomonas fontis]MDD0975245.1 glutathione S-transferase [Pseudomonas fontis]MDD0992215.1 glutathione S-transferase [Pseudomonas fontis]
MILYSFRRCPYAMRARMALHYSGCPVQICEVSLKAKPAEMLALSPKGTVPVLSVEGRVIEESLEIMRWALARHDPENWLLRDEPEAIEQMQALISRNDTLFKVRLNHYKYAERYPEQSREAYRALAEEILADLEARLTQHAYLLGERPSMADVALMPFIRQFAGVEPQWFAQAPYPGVRGWLQGWLESALFKAIMAR